MGLNSNEVNVLTVSLIVLAKGKGRLNRLLDSVFAQDFPDVEVVLVIRDPALKGESLAKGRPIKLIAPGEPVSRAVAANAGLEASSGEWVCVLDEQAWLDGRHVSVLMEGVGRARDNLVLFGDVRRHDDTDKAPVASGFWRQRLCERPATELSAMLFSRTLYARHGCRFDTAYTLFDDWDFMLQCAEVSDFLHVSALTSHHEKAGRAPGEKVVKSNLLRLQQKWSARYDEIRALANGASHQAADAIRRNAPDDALQPLQVALQVDPGNPLLLNQLAWCLRRKGDPAGALRAIRRACDSDPQAISLLGDRVVLEHQLGNVDIARQCFIQLVERSGTDREWARMKAIAAFIGAELEE